MDEEELDEGGPGSGSGSSAAPLSLEEEDAISGGVEFLRKRAPHLGPLFERARCRARSFSPGPFAMHARVSRTNRCVTYDPSASDLCHMLPSPNAPAAPAALLYLAVLRACCASGPASCVS